MLLSVLKITFWHVKSIGTGTNEVKKWSYCSVPIQDIQKQYYDHLRRTVIEYLGRVRCSLSLFYYQGSANTLPGNISLRLLNTRYRFRVFPPYQYQ